VLLGVMSDSHGRIERVRQALAVLDAERVDAVIHCGDVGGLEVLEELAGRRCWFVWGNSDYPQPAWRAEVQALGLPWPEGPVEIGLNGQRLAVYHGHERGFQQAISAGEFDYVLHGHTHRAADIRGRETRVINPGALHRVAVPTVAVLDVEADEVRFLPVTG
jgi:uncharacterized protein